ncbi:putative amidohydrolase YtcJ [Rhizobium sp. SG_E_25_P2]|uniref:amidohydrolase n=1 Tax=Rhizobium sp. SG_E_25_P2 TaxID=2879942 RepID=UPI002476B584|nr:amidohydrolase [Rhizobium sp. SG_E_25_P2]MDH6265979.1 putative amidohydrolase YtcJ [Rhizobium sp. SG_E_25_P2]
MTQAILIVNANVKTMDTAQPKAGAVLIEGNRIVAVGENDAITALAPVSALRLDARQATVMPGFNDSHVHIFPGSVGLTQLQLDGVMGFEALKTAIQTYAANTPGDGLLIAKGCSYVVISETEGLARQHLDTILPNRPLLIMAFDHHTAWANTASLKAADILHGRDVGVGNTIVMGEDGLATGELRESSAFGPVYDLAAGGGREFVGAATGGEPDHVTEANRYADMTTILAGLNYCASLGITSIQNMDGNHYQLQLLEAIEQAHGLPVRVRMPFHMKNHMPLADLEQKAAVWKKTYASDTLRCDAVKMFMDGVTESATALFVDDYADIPGWKGEALFSAEQFNSICVTATRLGMQIAVHAVGDGAVRMVLDGYEAAIKATGIKTLRHRVEHIELIHPDDISRFKELGVVASMQPIHAPDGPGDEGGAVRQHVGTARFPYSFAWRQLKDAGARMVFSTDWPVSPLDPLVSLQYALLRQPVAADAPDHRLDLDALLHGYTAEGAWVEFMEDRKGLIKPGYLADIVILTGDIDATPAEAFDTLAVAVTICNGTITYRGA